MIKAILATYSMTPARSTETLWSFTWTDTATGKQANGRISGRRVKHPCGRPGDGLRVE